MSRITNQRNGGGAPRQRGIVITMCILIALALWFIVRLTAEYSILVDMPTEILNMPPDTAFAALPPRTIQLRVQGAGTALFGLRRNPPQVIIDASENVVNVSASVILPQSVTGSDFFPESFEILKEERITRRVPVRSNVQLEPLATYDFFEEHTIIPDSVDISGARSVIGVLGEWPTDTLKRESIRDSIAVVVPLADTLAGLVTKSHTEVMVVSKPDYFTEDTRELLVLITDMSTMNDAVIFDPATVTVRYRVPLKQVEAVQEAKDFLATVSYDAIRSDTTGRINPQIQLPENFHLRNVEISPRTLEYFIYIGTE